MHIFISYDFPFNKETSFSFYQDHSKKINLPICIEHGCIVQKKSNYIKNHSIKLSKKYTYLIDHVLKAQIFSFISIRRKHVNLCRIFHLGSLASTVLSLDLIRKGINSWVELHSKDLV